MKQYYSPSTGITITQDEIDLLHKNGIYSLIPSDIGMQRLREALQDYPRRRLEEIKRKRQIKGKSALFCRPLVSDIVLGPVLNGFHEATKIYDYLYSLLGHKKNFSTLLEIYTTMLSLAKLDSFDEPVMWLSTTWLETCRNFSKEFEDSPDRISASAAKRCIEVLCIEGLLLPCKKAVFKDSCAHYTLRPTIRNFLEADFKWIGLECDVALDNQNEFFQYNCGGEEDEKMQDYFGDE